MNQGVALQCLLVDLEQGGGIQQRWCGKSENQRQAFESCYFIHLLGFQFEWPERPELKCYG